MDPDKKEEAQLPDFEVLNKQFAETLYRYERKSFSPELDRTELAIRLFGVWLNKRRAVINTAAYLALAPEVKQAWDRLARHVYRMIVLARESPQFSLKRYIQNPQIKDEIVSESSPLEAPKAEIHFKRGRPAGRKTARRQNEVAGYSGGTAATENADKRLQEAVARLRAEDAAREAGRLRPDDNVPRAET